MTPPFIHAPDLETESTPMNPGTPACSPPETPIDNPAEPREHTGQPDAPSGNGTRPHTKTFTATKDQVSEARQFLREILRDCPAVCEATLALSELAANACVHSASPERSGTFTVTAHILEGSHLRIEVHDDGGQWNQRTHSDDRPHGLDIVARLATAHGRAGDPLTGWTSWAVLGWHPAPPPTMNGQPDDHHG